MKLYSGQSEKVELPKGWLLWHSYSEYTAPDSKLCLLAPNGEIEIISGDFIRAMNGSFGVSPDTITFMAFDQTADEWDIYIREGGKITNLTQNSGFNNEDPKFSPDGKTIVFKRSRKDALFYGLALLDVKTGKVTMLTDTIKEQAMPCFSVDGKFIYYASYTGDIGSICRLDVASHKSETIYSEEGVSAYYPVVHGDELYFTKWFSAVNRHDQIMRYNGEKMTTLSFNSADYNCSDACPLDNNKMVFSSTMNGSYDLYYYDGRSVSALTALNSDKNELGACFFPYIATENLR